MTKLILFYLSFIVLLFSCKEREHSNPFDTDNDDAYLEIGLSLSSKDSLIIISWNIPSRPHFDSLAIFRKMETESHFNLLTTVSNTKDNFTDPVRLLDITYSYYIKIVGKDVESKATRTKSIIPGPGNIWLIDNFLWEINRLNYDLSASSLRKPGIWQPENLAFAHPIKRGLITYPLFNYIEIFDLENGNYLYGNSSISRPFDAVYDESINHFWLIDSIGSMYLIDSTAHAQFAGEFFKKPVQIGMVNNKLFILDAGRNCIYISNKSPSLVDSVCINQNGKHFTNLSLFRIDGLNQQLYILDKAPDNNTLYKYNLQTKLVKPVFSKDLIRTFDVNQQDESIWIIFDNKLNSILLQLSSTGDSLFNKPVYDIARDIKVNPVNGNVVVAKILEQVNVLDDKVFHYRSGTLIGAYRTYGDPYKVYIE
jgi:hypothetical protein